MHDSALDFLTFVLVLSVVTILSFNITLPVVKESRELYYSEIQDKTIGRTDGELVRTDEEEYMTKNEVMLQMIGQNQFMPAPGKIIICGEEVQVTNNLAFSPNSAGLGATVSSLIDNWFTQFYNSSLKNKFEGVPSNPNEAKFKLMFDMNNPDIKDDDTYSLYIKLKPIGKQEQIYKCTSGGKLVGKDGKAI